MRPLKVLRSVWWGSSKYHLSEDGKRTLCGLNAEDGFFGYYKNFLVNIAAGCKRCKAKGVDKYHG